MTMAMEMRFCKKRNLPPSDGKEQLATATITSTGGFPNFQMAKT